MQSPVPRVQVRPLIQVLVLALILPVGLAFLADWALGTSPLIAVVASVLCIPLTTVLVIQRTLHDMNAVIAVVAPPEVAAAEDASEKEVPGVQGEQAAGQESAAQKLVAQESAAHEFTVHESETGSTYK